MLLFIQHHLKLLMMGQVYSVYLYLNDPLDAAQFEVDERLYEGASLQCIPVFE
jgi:hypothetical protein